VDCQFSVEKVEDQGYRTQKTPKSDQARVAGANCELGLHHC